MDHAIDEGGRGGGVGEDGRPVAEGQVRGEDETLPTFVAAADNLEEKIRRAGVVGEIPDLIDLCGAPHKSIYGERSVMWSAASQPTESAGFPLL